MIENQLLAVPKGFDLRAVVGKSKSGKDRASGMMVDYVRAQGGTAEFKSTSSILRSYAEDPEGQKMLAELAEKEAHIFDEQNKVTPHGLFKLGVFLQEVNGEDCLTITLLNEAIRKYRDGQLDAFFVNGLRRKEEGRLIRGLHLPLIWIDAVHNIRYKRAERLGVVRSKVDFYIMERPQYPDLSYLRKRSTMRIDNNGTEDELFSEVVSYMMK